MIEGVLGCGALGGILAVTAILLGLALRRRGLEADREFPAQDRPPNLSGFPLVTVVIPARDEERNIAACLASLRALDYPRLEILVADDGSVDATAAIVREESGRTGPLHRPEIVDVGNEPHPGLAEWICRKGLAIWAGARKAKGEWLLFIDADTRLKPDALWRAMALARRRGLMALSMSGVNINPGFWGGIMEAVLNPAIFLAISWSRVNDPARPAAWMNGQFILYEKSAYFRAGGHEAIAAFISDDLALALRAKAMGIPFLFIPISAAYDFRDYAGLREAFRGWTRRLAAGGAQLRLPLRSYALQVAALFIVGVWPLLAVLASIWAPLAERLVLGLPFRTWALVQLGLVILLQAALRAVMKMPIGPSILAPAGAALAIAAVAGGFKARRIKGSVMYRGRALAIREGKARSRYETVRR